MKKDIDIEYLKAKLSEGLFGREIHYYDTISSTIDIANQLAQNGCLEGTLVLADEQTSARGRGGKSWYSPPGLGIWTTIILRPNKTLNELTGLPIAAAVSISKAVEKVASVDAETGFLKSSSSFPKRQLDKIDELISQIKWPNDPLIGGKKYGGILVESKSEGNKVKYVLISFGVNVNQHLDDFPEEIKTTATSLCLACGREFDRNELLLEILETLEQDCTMFLESGLKEFLQFYASRDYLINKKVVVKVSEKTYIGTASGIDEHGSLVLITENKNEVRISTGEVNLVRVY